MRTGAVAMTVRVTTRSCSNQSSPRQPADDDREPQGHKARENARRWDKLRDHAISSVHASQIIPVVAAHVIHFSRRWRHELPKALREDVRLLGELLGETLRRQEGQAIFDLVERVRALAKKARGGSDADFATLTRILEQMPVDEALPVARAFSHFLNLANIAEQHHRIRRRRDYQRDKTAPPQIGSCDETFGRLIAAGIPPDRLHEAISRLRIELVFTAHPTEVTRRTLMQKFKRIADLLERARSRRPHAARARRAAQRAAHRDRRVVGNQRSPAAAPLAGRRGAVGHGGLRAGALGRGAAVPPLAQRRAGQAHRPRAAARPVAAHASARGLAATATATRR